MGKIILLWLILLIILAWCDTNHNFMDVDNPNAKEDLKHYVSYWELPQINPDDIIPESLSWVREDAKWYANQYYDDVLGEYVDIAKQWLSWAKENLKWYYNSWVDELNKMIREKVNETISWELNKFKIK